MTDDYRTEPLEVVIQTGTGTVTTELRGTVDRDARKLALTDADIEEMRANLMGADIEMESYGVW
jgi:hypothetical protein